MENSRSALPPTKPERLESPVADQAVEQDGLGERVPLARLVVDLHLPEEAELPLLDGLSGQPLVRTHPGGALGVAGRRRPLAAAGLGVNPCRQPGRHARENDRDSNKTRHPISAPAHFVPAAASRPKQ